MTFDYPRTILHKCGHSQFYRLSAHNASEADRYAANLRKIVCPECEQAAANRPAELKGSEKQVKWALAIRAKLSALAGEKAPRLNRISEARWFIDHRDIDPAQLRQML